MNDGLLERKEGTEKVREVINYTNCKVCRLIMEDWLCNLGMTVII